ncbi:hypothetical protein DYI37_11990 [Fulvimarina endophytica]|uniref:Uncharacterized protein n=1 Tax=Fulvimarina endophytica TaxID=2293836 RepID=A0A371X3B7_9HYPH|nr:hypothetical protein [Fulvimarina endophytica]RFC63712.1 hypothetical protein DYI37_11990 [Fulvimarina endophytica]
MKKAAALFSAALLSASTFAIPASAQNAEEIVPGSESLGTSDEANGVGGEQVQGEDTDTDMGEADGAAVATPTTDAGMESSEERPVAAQSTDEDNDMADGDEELVPGKTSD